jgi:GTP cyclohydrolase I
MENKPSNAQVDADSVVEFRCKQTGKTLSLTTTEMVAGIIQAIGDNPKREGVLDTPRRVVKSWKEIYAGYRQDPVKILGTTFEKGKYDQMVICKDIELYSTCEHHMIPFFGKAHIGYIPGERVVGLSKLARVVDVFARRLQIQEKMTQQIADVLNDVLKPKGVMVVVEAKHMCMCARGVGKQNSSMITSAIHGLFKEKKVRTEFLDLIR